MRSAADPQAEAFLPYAEVAGVEVETRLHPNGTNSWHTNTQQTARGLYLHHAVLRLRDGAKWTLTEADTREETEAQAARLRAALGAGAPTAAGPAPPLPAQVSCSAEGLNTTLRWQSQLTRREVVG